MQLNEIYINAGTHRLSPSDLSYPIRDLPENLKATRYCQRRGTLLRDDTSKHCRKCEDFLKSEKHQRPDFPTREKLCILIRSYSFTQIAKQYEVSDNAIRKWCKKLALPWKKEQICILSEEEWEKLEQTPFNEKEFLMAHPFV